MKPLDIFGIFLILMYAVSNSIGSDLVLIPNEVPNEDTDEASVENYVKPNLDDVFQASEDWQEIRPGQVVPSGLHVRINLETGKKEARLMPEEENAKKDSIKNIDDETFGKAADGSDPVLRSFRDLQDMKVEQDIKFNTEFEQIQTLMGHFGNSSLAERTTILEDLEFLLHQYDNARDFVNVGGLDKIILKVMETEQDEQIRAVAFKLLSSCVQSHAEVKEKILAREWPSKLVTSLPNETPLVQQRIIHALGCLVRNHPRSVQEFAKVRGFESVLNLLKSSDSLNLVRKTLVFIADAFETNNDSVSSLQETQIKVICDKTEQLVLQSANDVENVILAQDTIDVLKVLQDMCGRVVLKQMKTLQNFLADLRAKDKKEQLEFGPYLQKLDIVLSKLQKFRDEL